MRRALFVLTIVLLMLANPAPLRVSAGQAHGAIVLHRDQSSCEVVYQGQEESLYQGSGHYVQTPGGQAEFHCTAALASGPGAPATIHAPQGECRVVINRNVANVACDAAEYPPE